MPWRDGAWEAVLTLALPFCSRPTLCRVKADTTGSRRSSRAALCRLSCWFVSSDANARWAQVVVRSGNTPLTSGPKHPLPLPSPAGQPRGGPSRRPARPGEGALLCSWDG